MNETTISIISGDIFRSRCQTLVVPTNSVGAMGSGLALAFKNRVPGLYERYRHFHFNKQLDVYKLFRYKWPGTDKQLILLPTKKHWRDPSDVRYIVNNLEKLVANQKALGIESIAFPMLGCGLGELSESTVLPIMTDILSRMNCPVEIIRWDK